MMILKSFAVLFGFIGFILLPPLLNYDLAYKDALAEWTIIAFWTFIICLVLLGWIGKTLENKNEK